MYGYIYLTTNLVNGKKYIGQHKAKCFDKNYYGSGKLLIIAIKKYTYANFSCEILNPINNVPTICESAEELNNSEAFYIDYYNCVNSDDYYNLVRGGHQSGFAESVKKVMSDKAKHRVHNPTTAGRIYITDGHKNKCINSEEIEIYLNNGWYIGKTSNVEPWNKGLTKETDERVMKYTNSRNKCFENNEYIGFTKPGKDSPNYKSDEYIIKNIINKGFKEIWEEHGKCYVCSVFHCYRIYNRCLKLAGISPEEDRAHKKTHNSK